jgi:hypothetical protein
MKMKQTITMRAVAIGLVLSSMGAAFAVEFRPSTKGKKLVTYGWNGPTTAFVRANIKQMEKSPLHGTVLRVAREPGKLYTESTKENLCWQPFSTERFKPKEYEHAIADLKATEFTTMTHNFVGLTTMPGIDIADDEAWASTVHNCQILARIAAAGGCVGLHFDAERYSSSSSIKMWSYDQLSESRKNQYTRKQYHELMRSRGVDMMRAFNKEFPGLSLLFFFGPSCAVAESDYELLLPFVEGLCQVAKPGTKIIDGREATYGLRHEEVYRFHRHVMKVETRELFQDKSLFDKYFSVGYAAWLDCWGHWSSDNPEENYYTPDTWQTTLHYALKHADEYVWIYEQLASWWEEGPISAAYRQAQRNAYQGPGRPDVPERLVGVDRQTFNAHGMSDFEELAELLAQHDELTTLPTTGWVFKKDPDMVGMKQRWYDPGLCNEDWFSIEIGRFWEERGIELENYDGFGWYRSRITAPQLPKDKPIHLVFGGVDETAIVWIDGKKVGKFHKLGGWRLPFAMDVTDFLSSGQKHQITICVIDRAGGGGIWRPVRIMTPK